MRPTQVAQLLALALVWGGAYLFMRASAPAFGAAPMAFLRMLLGSALVLLPLMIWRTGLRPLLLHWRQLTVMGVAFTALPFLGLGFAALSISAGMLAILQSAAPLFAALVARIWLGETIGRRRALGLAIGFAGVVLLVWDKVGIREDAGVAVLVTLLVTALWGVSSNYARVKMRGIDPIVSAAGSIGIAAVVLLPIAVATWPVQMPPTRAWLEVLFLGIAASGLGFVLYFRLLAQVGAVRATSVTFLNPIVAMASAAVYLGEPITLRMLAGCAIVLTGTALTLGLLPRAKA
jgi:drug/metabolite transporter (DMT)-like permease